MNNQLTPLQSKLLDMFSWFHEYCVNNNVRYYALGGTMLGAARHQGFIPWDDDIDVGIPRKDYERLKKMANQKQDSKYCFEFPETSDEIFATPYGKVYDTTTTLIERYRKPLKRGIYIDIFPLDGTGDDEISSKRAFDKLKTRYDFYMTRVAALNKKRALFKNVAIICSRAIPSSFVSNRKLRITMDCLAARCDFEKSVYGGNIFGNWGYKEIMKVSIMGTPKEYTFNGITIFGVEKYDEYLTSLYGDWHKLPPLEKQVTHHDYIDLNLDKSFLYSEDNK